MKQFSVKFVGMFAVVAFALTVATPASAQTIAELQALIAQLQQQIAALAGGTSSPNTTTSYTFTADLTLGSTGADVVALQSFLESKGMLTIPAGVSKGYFGELTRSALAQYQMSKMITPAVGYFGPITRAAVNQDSTVAVNPGTPTNPSNPSTGLNGGAGSIEEFDVMSEYSNEEVGEGQDDVVVYGLEIEADDQSDLEIMAVTLNFGDNVGVDNEVFANGSDKLEDYATEVSVWFNGEKVAEVDAEDLDDDNEYRRTISLDRGVVIEAGDTEEILVAISSVGNIDSADFDQSWTVEIESVRYMDAQGTVIIDNVIPATSRTFSFETFASATNAELKIIKGDDSINDSRTLTISDTDDTDDVEIFAFETKVEGGSDLTVDEIVVEFVIDGTATTLDDIATRVSLWLDGDEIDSMNATADNTVTFEDLDLELEAGDTYEFVVAVDVMEYDAAGTYDLGDTILAKVTTAERNLWDIEDEEGDSLDNTDRTGTATSDAHTLNLVEFEVSINDSISQANDVSGSGSISFTFDVDAIEEELVIDATAFAAVNDIYVTLSGADTGIASYEFTKISGDATNVGDVWTINEGEDAKFVLDITFTTVDAADNGVYRATLETFLGQKIEMTSDPLTLAF